MSPGGVQEETGQHRAFSAHRTFRISGQQFQHHGWHRSPAAGANSCSRVRGEDQRGGVVGWGGVVAKGMHDKGRRVFCFFLFFKKLL